MHKSVIAAFVVMAACGPLDVEAPAPKAVQQPGERNDALFAAAAKHAVPAEVLMLAAWKQTRFELAEREEVLAPAAETELPDDALAADEPLADEAAPDVTPEDDAAIPPPLAQEERLGVEPDDAPRFGLFAVSPVQLPLAADADAVAARLAEGGERPLTFEAWGPAIVEALLPDADADVRAEVLRELQDAWLDGFDVTTADGERVTLRGAGRDVAVAEQALKPGKYPPLTVIPASSANFGSRGGAKIRFIVIHDIEGTQAGAIAVFKNPSAKVSAHYVTRASDGRIVKMVNESAAAWHAGHSWFNRRSIGIEHEGFADRSRGGGFYTDRQYQASANLVCAIAKKYRIPIDRKHIFGHGNVPSNLSSTTLCSDSAANAARCGGFGHHHDPGKFWAWSSYLARIRRCVNAAK